MTVEVTALDLAMRFVGVHEGVGVSNNPAVVAMLKLDNTWPEGDDVPWCSAFVNYIAWLLRLPRSKDLSARSWLRIGIPVDLKDAKPGFDVVVLSRGDGKQPGPDVLAAPGHVGLFVSHDQYKQQVHLLGGNQGDQVCVAPYNSLRLLGVRRLLWES